jgi:integrase
VRYAAAIRDTPIDQIDDMAVRSALMPIWLTVPETASRVRGRCEEIWDYAKVHGWVHGENPFRWKGNLQHVLPRRPKLEQRHLAAMDYRDIPEFLKELRTEETAARLCFEFLVLTASRSAEAREAMWTEIDFTAAVWSLPPERMKAGQSHRVPLPTRAIAILEIMQARRAGGDYVFPSAIKPSRPVSEYPLHKLLPSGVTLHGMRSAFRDWCAECTNYPREICEEALAHSVGNVVERSYRRSDLLERRRELMEAWAQHCARLAVENVIPIGAGKR